MMAAYFAFFGMATFGLPWYVSFIVAIILTALLGMGIEFTAYRPLRNAPKISALISAIGVSFLLENLAVVLFGGRPKAFPDIKLFTDVVVIGGVSIQNLTFIIPIVTIIILFVLLHLVNNTNVGMAMRAASKDVETARLMGINVNRIISFTFAIGSGLAALGSMMWCVKYPQIVALMGMMPGLKCFIAAVIGGIGDIKGAVIGGFILGLTEIMLVGFFPGLTGYRDALAFILLIIILLFKPTGIMGKNLTEKV